MKELFLFVAGNKRWWMVPLAACFVVLGAVMWLVQSPAVVPFIYTLF